MGLMSTVKHAFKDDDKESVHSHHSTKHAEIGRPVATSTTVVENTTVPAVAANTTAIVGENVEGASYNATRRTSRTETATVPVANYSADLIKEKVTHVAEPVVETQTKTNAAIVQATHHENVETVIQPTMDINKSKVEVQQVYVPVEDKRVYEEHEHVVNPTQVSESVEEISDEAAARYQRNASQFVASNVELDTTKRTVVKPADVTEHVHITQVQEITPVIHREETVNKIVHTDQHIVKNLQLAPEVKEVKIAAPISIKEFEAQGGVIDANITTRNVREL